MSLLLAFVLANAPAVFVPGPGEPEHPITFESDCKVAYRFMTAPDPEAALTSASVTDAASAMNCLHYVFGVTDAMESVRQGTGKDAVVTHNGLVCTGGGTTVMGLIQSILARGAIKADTCEGCADHRFGLVTAALQSMNPCP